KPCRQRQTQDAPAPRHEPEPTIDHQRQSKSEYAETLFQQPFQATGPFALQALEGSPAELSLPNLLAVLHLKSHLHRHRVSGLRKTKQGRDKPRQNTLAARDLREAMHRTALA